MKKILFLLTFFAIAMGSWAQGAMDEQASKIALTPMVSPSIKLPQDARTALETKLMQIVSRNGLGSTSGTFAITPNVVIVSKDVTTTVPAQYVVQLEIVLFVVEPKSKTVVSQMSLPIKGVAPMENKAYLQAINSINANSGSIKKFIDNSRVKIVEYYNSQLPTIISRVQMMIAQNKYDQAMVMLLEIPEQITNYHQVSSMIADLYKMKINHQAIEILHNADIALAKGDYHEVLNLLSQIDPYSASAGKASAIVTKIREINTGAKSEEFAEVIKNYDAAQAQKASRYPTSADGKTASYSVKGITQVARLASSDLVGASAQASQTEIKDAVNEWVPTLFGN